MTFTEKVKKIADVYDLRTQKAIAEYLGVNASTLAHALKAERDGETYFGALSEPVEAAIRTISGAQAVSSRAVLADITISFWAARAYDSNVTEEVLERHGASKEAGRFRKNLLGGKCKEFTRLHRAEQNLRRTHRELTLPWGDANALRLDGPRLLPNAVFMEYGEKMRKVMEEFEEAKEAFGQEFANIKERAKAALNGMFKEDDYPDDVTSRYHARMVYTPVPMAGDFRAELPAEAIAEIQSSVEDQVARATRAAVQDAWNRLYEMVQVIHERFLKSLEERGENERDYNVRQGLLDQARDLTDLLGKLNVTGDPDLERMRAAVAKELAGADANSLRDDEEKRKQTANRAQEILDEMTSIYGGPKQAA